MLAHGIVKQEHILFGLTASGHVPVEKLREALGKINKAWDETPLLDDELFADWTDADFGLPDGAIAAEKRKRDALKKLTFLSAIGVWGIVRRQKWDVTDSTHQGDVRCVGRLVRKRRIPADSGIMTALTTAGSS